MTNRFRKEYRQLSDYERALMDNLKDQAEVLAQCVDNVPDGRMKALAMTKLEEATMWAVKGITG